jgi:excisionase family DNA binding protein
MQWHGSEGHSARQQEHGLLGDGRAKGSPDSLVSEDFDLAKWSVADEAYLFTTAVTPEAVAGRLSVSRAKVYELMATGKLRSFKIDRSRRILLADLAVYIRHQLEGGEE